MKNSPNTAVMFEPAPTAQGSGWCMYKHLKIHTFTFTNYRTCLGFSAPKNQLRHLRHGRRKTMRLFADWKFGLQASRAVAIGSQNQIDSRKTMDGEDPLETGMNKGEPEKLGSRRPFGSWAAAKVTRCRKPWTIKTAIHLKYSPPSLIYQFFCFFKKTRPMQF